MSRTPSRLATAGHHHGPRDEGVGEPVTGPWGMLLTPPCLPEPRVGRAGGAATAPSRQLPYRDRGRENRPAARNPQGGGGQPVAPAESAPRKRTRRADRGRRC